MWKRNATVDGARMRLLTCEHLFKKSFGFVDFPAADVGCEHVHDFTNRIRRFSRAQSEDNLLFVEEICERDRHGGRRDLLDYEANAVIQLNRRLWQLKIQRSRRKRNGQFPCNGAFTTRVMSTPCRIFIGANWDGSWSGGNGWI